MAKISELPILGQGTDSDVLPILHEDNNYGVTLDTLKRYFFSGSLMLFQGIVTANVTVTTGSPTEENGAVIDIVYLSTKKAFAARKTISGSVSYFSTFDGYDNYMGTTAPRTDRLFYNTEDRLFYMYIGTNLTSTEVSYTREEVDNMLQRIAPTEINDITEIL